MFSFFRRPCVVLSRTFVRAPVTSQCVAAKHWRQTTVVRLNATTTRYEAQDFAATRKQANTNGRVYVVHVYPRIIRFKK